MRVDKFLKVARLIKRRAVAKEAAEVGRVFVNGREAKPAAQVQPGDRMVLELGRRQVTLEVLQVAEHVRADQAHTLYRILEEAPLVP